MYIYHRCPAQVRFQILCIKLFVPLINKVFKTNQNAAGITMRAKRLRKKANVFIWLENAKYPPINKKRGTPNLPKTKAINVLIPFIIFIGLENAMGFVFTVRQ